MLFQDSEDEIRSRFVFELAIWLWQDELNPRVCCAFGNVLYIQPRCVLYVQSKDGCCHLSVLVFVIWWTYHGLPVQIDLMFCCNTQTCYTPHGQYWFRYVCNFAAWRKAFKKQNIKTIASLEKTYFVLPVHKLSSSCRSLLFSIVWISGAGWCVFAFSLLLFDIRNT